MSKKYIKIRRDEAEASGYSCAAEVLLVGLRHIKEHRFSHPIEFSGIEDWAGVVDELIWYCEKLSTHEIFEKDELERAEKGRELLSKHFEDIWC